METVPFSENSTETTVPSASDAEAPASPSVEEAAPPAAPTVIASATDLEEKIAVGLEQEEKSIPKAVPRSIRGPVLKVHEDCLLESVGFQFDDDFFFVMLHAGASLTTFGGRVFSTSADWQTELSIPVYAGTNSFASRNRPLGVCLISGVPAGPRGKARVEIRFTACEDGTLSITASAKDSGRELAVELKQD